jgi:hypothetical protein
MCPSTVVAMTASCLHETAGAEIVPARNTLQARGFRLQDIGMDNQANAWFAKILLLSWTKSA